MRHPRTRIHMYGFTPELACFLSQFGVVFPAVQFLQEDTVGFPTASELLRCAPYIRDESKGLRLSIQHVGTSRWTKVLLLSQPLGSFQSYALLEFYSRRFVFRVEGCGFEVVVVINLQCS